MRVCVAVLLALVASGCVPTDFTDLRGQAPTAALVPPADYPVSGFGAVLSGFSGQLRGQFASRVAAGSATTQQFEVFAIYNEETLDLETTVLEVCDEDVRCDPGAGAAFASMPVWAADRVMCVATASTETGLIDIRCEDDPSHFETVNGPSAERFGASAAGLPDHPFARAIFGAPGAAGSLGAVYRLPERAPPVALDLSEGTGTGTELGTAVAATVVDADTVLIAAAAPGSAAKRVIVASSDVAADGTITTRVRDCLDETAEGWGEALAFGDLNADGIVDLAIGSGPGGSRLEVVRVYDGASLPPVGTCDGSWTPSIEIACTDAQGASCTDAQFGSAVAIGDVDGDGIGDLIVGAPLARVDDVGEAGAAFVYRGAGTIAGLGGTVAVLRHSSPLPGAHLGAAVASAPGAVMDAGTGRRRDEPVVGAPGSDRVYVFLCSGLDQDSPETTGERCQPPM